MNITSAGIGSGLDLEGIIEAYINAEAIPQEIRLQKKEDRLKTEISGLGQFKSALSSFESVLKKLSKTDAFNKQTIESSTTDISVTTNGFASNGSFSIEVEQLAKGTRLESDKSFAAATDVVGSGTLSFNAGASTFDVLIDATDSLSTIRDKINEKSDNFGVVANVITSDAGTFLTYSSTLTGSANNLTVTSTGTLDSISNAGATQVQAAQDAIIYIDTNKVTSDTNEFKNVIEDVTITANKANLGNPSTLTIAQDKENGVNLLNEFVNGYNALVNTMSDLSNAENGELAFDSSIRQMKSQFNSIIGNTVSGLSGSLDSLDSIGITLTKTGTLEISAVGFGTLPSGIDKRDEALANKLNEVGELFASTNGVSTKMSELIESYNGSDGSLTKRESTLNADLTGIKDEYDELEAKLRSFEDTLRRKFTFLDSTVASYNATSSWLSSALKLPEKK
jgi:flagellar hook-associated protein 2